jgi:hypothetical protein
MPWLTHPDAHLDMRQPLPRCVLRPQSEGFTVLAASQPPSYHVCTLLPGYRRHEARVTVWDEGAAQGAGLATARMTLPA